MMGAITATPAGAARRRGGYSDLVLVAGIVAIVAMMVLPLPIWLIDMLVAVNIAIGFGLLLLAIYIQSPRRVLVVPERAAADHAVPPVALDRHTRMILLHGEAGHIIDTFGKTGRRRQPGRRPGGVPDHHRGPVHRGRQGRRARRRSGRALHAGRDAGQAAVDRFGPALRPDRQGRSQAPPPHCSNSKASCTAASTAR